MIDDRIWRKLMLYIFSIVIFTNFHSITSTVMEDKLETQIDPREPRFFHHLTTKMLAVRIPGFNNLTRHFPDHDEMVPVPNWEVFANRYWYEYRTPNTSCGQVPSRIAARCDWALMIPCLFGDISKPPRTIFVHNLMLPHFIESTMYFMNESYRFVLVTGGTDLTIPRSVDPRYHPLRGFRNSEDGGSYFETLINSPHLIHWFSENHDITHHRISTLPTGMSVDKPDDSSDFPPPETIQPLLSRRLSVLLSDRVRSGTGVWALRYQVLQMCSASPLCTRPGNGSASMLSEGISHKEYLQLLASVPFVACVRGGGLDPSPKAWEAIWLGTIPIIQRSTLDDGYERFPVVFVNNWSEIFESENAVEFLRGKLVQLAPYYEEGSEKRRKVLEKLETDYWVGLFEQKVKEYDEHSTTHSKLFKIDDRRLFSLRGSLETFNSSTTI